jgi:HEPN domain-containing protein
MTLQMKDGFSMQSPEYTRILLNKAAQDKFALEVLAQDDNSAREIIGFHAQQAIEKLLKAVLNFNNIRFRRTHDLVELIDLLNANDITCPDFIEDSRRLNPFATLFRYDELLEDDDSLFEPEWALQCVRDATAWAEGVILSNQ